MRSNLIVVHKLRSQSEEQGSQLPSPWVDWQTCIRRIGIGFEPNVSPVLESSVSEIFRGREAYKFLLEIVCGLHSPIKGETEVHGQFKQILEQIGSGHYLYKLLHGLHLDARKVRTAHLRGLGSQSYGSLARRKMRGHNEAHIIGAGQLTRELLPWLAKLEIPVHIYARQPERHADLAEKYSTVRLWSMNEKRDADKGALLIAAPVTSDDAANWLTGRAGLELILDYRGESHNDPLQVDIAYCTLQDIFREIESTKEKMDAEVEKARLLIQSLIHEN